MIFTSISFFILRFRRLSATLVCLSSLYDVVCLSFFVQVFVRFRLSYQFWYSVYPINDFDIVDVTNPNTWVFRRLEYNHTVNFCTLPFYAINIDVVSLFANSSFLFLANLHCINVPYQFERMNIIYFCKKNNTVNWSINLKLLIKNGFFQPLRCYVFFLDAIWAF